MKNHGLRAALLALVFILAGCGAYEAISWKDVGGSGNSLPVLGEGLVSSLAVDVIEGRNKIFLARSGRQELSRKNLPSLKVIVAAFPEARSGLRTAFSRKIEQAVRQALEKSALFAVIDGGDGVSWQEAALSRFALVPPVGWRGVLGRLDEEVALRAEQGGSTETIRREFERVLDDDHPIRGLWPKVREANYGEGSAIHAASMLGADAAVFGAYALGPDRVRVWATVVINRPAETIYYKREVKDLFALPERLEVSRQYAGLARGYLSRKTVPDALLSKWLPPRPRAFPRHPKSWGEPDFEVKLERIDLAGNRSPLIGGDVIDSESLVVGRLGVGEPRYIYGFAIDRYGHSEEILTSIEARKKPALVVPGKVVHFSARLLPAGRAYRVYFVSSKKEFDAKKIVDMAGARLGISKAKPTIARNYKDAARGAPSRSWYVPPVQERLILVENWDQYIYWVHRKNENN
ncbi:MAG: hypothetical protein HOE85_16550 [Nitrospinaceae bacterium]|nr:hypothetical protein [Nitrospinaceae bacterium]